MIFFFFSFVKVSIFLTKSELFIMDIFYFLIGVSLFAALIFLVIFIKAVKTGQFDDTYTPSVRILFDDEINTKTNEKDDKSKKNDKI